MVGDSHIVRLEVTRSAPPRVCVIVSTFNSSRTLQLTLTSIRLQQYADFECWIVGDGCTDNSAEVIEGFHDHRFHWLNLATNSGNQSAPNNAGFAASRSPLIAYLGHDDLWFPHHLKTLVEHQARTDADLIYGVTATFDRSGLREIVGTPRSSGGNTWHCAPPSSWLHTRELAQSIGGWRPSEQLATGVDMDFYHRAHAAGAKVEMAQRLTLLKFPSPHFKIYAKESALPQVEFLKQLQTDPQLLEHTLLTRAATKLAHLQFGDPTFIDMTRYLKRIFLRKARKFVLASPFLTKLEVIRFQRYRRVMRKTRGLSSK